MIFCEHIIHMCSALTLTLGFYSTYDSKSVTSSVIEYEYENGRRYHGYKAGSYPLPNDEVCLALAIQVFRTPLHSGEMQAADLRYIY